MTTPAARITFASVTTALARAWRSWRDRGALLPTGTAGPWGDYADPDRDRARFLADLRAHPPARCGSTTPGAPPHQRVVAP